MKNSVEADGVRYLGHKPHLSIVTAGFSTTLSQVAGLHRAVPSTTLDKVFSFRMYYNSILRLVK